MSKLRTLLAGDIPVVAPLALDPLSAKMAEAAGFLALYLGGGALGYLKCVTEANLSLPEMTHVGLEIRTVCSLPLILDGACGWGDPMHMHRTIGMTEAAGFSAIEVEDQIMPKRAHHHIGVEHLVPQELMVAKIAECVRARRDPEFVIIGRTNAARTDGVDEALRRAEAYREAGADVLLVLSARPDDIRKVGERLGGPLMYMPSGGGLWSGEFTLADLAGLGYRLIVDPTTPLLNAYVAMRDYYKGLKGGTPDPLGSGGPRAAAQAELHATIGLQKLLDIERLTVE
jgi:2-methylisocitrate lyase-like PEP mutase family enzyme